MHRSGNIITCIPISFLYFWNVYFSATQILISKFTVIWISYQKIVLLFPSLIQMFASGSFLFRIFLRMSSMSSKTLSLSIVPASWSSKPNLMNQKFHCSAFTTSSLCYSWYPQRFPSDFILKNVIHFFEVFTISLFFLRCLS